MQQQRIRILGVPIDSVSMDQAVERLVSFTASRPCRQIVTVNPEFIMVAQRNTAFAAVLHAADLSIADGIGLVWAARWRRQTLPERVAGVDLVERAAAAAAQRGLRIFLLGAQPGVAEATSDILCARYPGLIIAGTYAGSPAPAEDDALVALVNKATPDILFVAYGAPQQDLWIARNRERLNTGVAVGVGGAFDFISGRRRRAPRWVQRIGMEWLFRLYKEPWRWRRMLALPRFAWAVLREKYSPLDNVG